MRPSKILLILIVALAFFSCGAMIMNARQQQTALDGAHNHPIYETALSQNRATDAKQSTEIAALQATNQVIPSPTLITSSPTKTITPQSTVPTPTQEDARTPSNTPFATFTPTRTFTPSNTQIATRPPFLDPDFTCRIVTTSNLTKRLTPSPTAENLGVLPAGSNVLIAPYQGSIPYTTTNGYFYVPVMENREIAYYILYARTSPPSLATPNVTPQILETFLSSADPNIPCIPLIIRN